MTGSQWFSMAPPQSSWSNANAVLPSANTMIISSYLPQSLHLQHSNCITAITAQIFAPPSVRGKLWLRPCISCSIFCIYCILQTSCCGHSFMNGPWIVSKMSGSSDDQMTMKHLSICLFLMDWSNRIPSSARKVCWNLKSHSLWFAWFPPHHEIPAFSAVKWHPLDALRSSFTKSYGNSAPVAALHWEQGEKSNRMSNDNKSHHTEFSWVFYI